jgi:hypothetical protein
MAKGSHWTQKVKKEYPNETVPSESRILSQVQAGIYNENGEVIEEILHEDRPALVGLSALLQNENLDEEYIEDITVEALAIGWKEIQLQWGKALQSASRKYVRSRIPSTIVLLDCISPHIFKVKFLFPD